MNCGKDIYTEKNYEYSNIVEADCAKDIVTCIVESGTYAVDYIVSNANDIVLGIAENDSYVAINDTDLIAVATIVTAAVALYAAVQPWLIAFINKKRNRVILIPNEHITIYYGRDGLSLQFFFTLVSEHMDSIVKNIRIILIGSDASRHEFKWDTFRSTHYESIYATKAPKNSPARDTEFSRGISAYAHPVYLRTQVAHLLNVIFTESNIMTPVQLKLKGVKHKIIIEITNTDDKCYTDDRYEIEVTDSNIKTLESQRSCELSGKTGNQKPVMVNIVDVSKKKGIERAEVK